MIRGCWIAAFIYCTCTALRLARFNTKTETADKQFFQGLPSPAAAALIAGLVWIMLDFKIEGPDIKWLAWGITLFAGFSMVSNLPFYSGKEINLHKSVPFITVLLIALFFFVLIPSHPPVVLFCLFMLYALSGYVMWLWRWQKKKKTTGMQKT
ncbi:MAG: phosphatidylcholine/phosphatidylserine synthase [Nitrosomonadaceae bacterium]